MAVGFNSLAGLFLASFLAATLLPGSSEVSLAYLASQSPQSVPLLFSVALIGNTLGSMVNYFAGYGLMRYASRRWFPASSTWVERATRLFNSYGAWILLFAWAPLIGDPLTVAAGALRVRFIWFLLLVALGKALRYLAVLAGFNWLWAWLA